MVEQTRVSAGIGGSLSLEFANTAGWHLAARPVERLGSWRDMVHWAAEQKLVHADQMDDLLAAMAEVGPALELREAIFRIGVAVARGDAPEKGDLNAVMAWASGPPPDAIWSGGSLSWRFQHQGAMPQLLGIVARDAVALLASDRVARLRLCAGSDCGWLFLDESRGKPRRWCSMGDCGNRSKARRAYARRKG
ncbi:CGNR zinc finger domain-containing protein [Sphingomonas sp. CBMAI 2297]|uniref:CGNR zinc finger domain-containing protein n=1 Tax=Sphingomonas sp. CBMAI 2297 TaxID=2991720 RepID=UPI002455399F|nr:ABATE domain-containing protein [Sphingomonas sp. CBMAI 2297]MDH4746185.1 CGNR zinc finger domain-containing protein [Sphingomonas sp. CBMAI 2297]